MVLDVVLWKKLLLQTALCDSTTELKEPKHPCLCQGMQQGHHCLH